MLKSDLEVGKVILHRVPHFVEVNAEVGVDERVSHRRYRPPGDVRILSADVLRKLCDSFSDNLKVIGHPRLDQLIAVEGGALDVGVTLDLLDRLQDVEEPGSSSLTA